MAAPTPTTRITPSGTQLGRGAPIFVTFASNPNIDLWEEAVTPPGVAMDARKDSSTFHNDRWRTFRPGRLKTMQDFTMDCRYDPNSLQEIYDLLGVRDTVTITLPTGTQIAFYGWVDQISFNAHNEDDDPMVTLTIAIGNQDWDTCEEEDPVIVPGTGTLAEC